MLNYLVFIFQELEDDNQYKRKIILMLPQLTQLDGFPIKIQTFFQPGSIPKYLQKK
jgi:hypothetical protein